MIHTTVWNDALRSHEELIGTDRAMRSVGNYATPLFRLPTGTPTTSPCPSWRPSSWATCTWTSTSTPRTGPRRRVAIIG